MNYSGDSWPVISGSRHAKDACRLLNMRTKTDLQKAESELGCRYSTLLKLNSPRMPIDPMHNLFWAQYCFKQGILNDTHFVAIQEWVDKVTVPPDIGRIPHKILSGFASFTVDQCKNWVLYKVTRPSTIFPVMYEGIRVL